MKLKALALLAFGLSVPAICSAQSQSPSVKPGTWTGTVIPPGETQAIPLTFDVTVNGDSLGIVLHVGEHGNFTTEKGHHADGNISFIFYPPEVEVTCTLTRKDDGTYDGPCLGSDGTTASMTMIPPKE